MPARADLSESCLLKITSLHEFSVTTQSADTFAVVANATEIKGDTNFDCKIDTVDIGIIRNVSLGVFTPTATEFWIADVNDDGEIDVVDIQKTVNWILDDNWNPTIKITSPTRDSEWRAGHDYSIKWTSELISPTSELVVEVLSENGQTWTTVLDSTKNDGSELWQPALEQISNQCQISMSTAACGVFASSDKFKVWPPTDPVIQPVYDDSVCSPGDEICLDIQVGSPEAPVPNLFDVEFRLKYPPNAVVLNLAEIGDFMGNDAIIYNFDTSRNGIILVGMRKKPGTTDYQNYGCVLKCSFKLDENAQDGTTLDFTIDNVKADDSENEDIRLTPQSLSIRVIDCIETWPGDSNRDGIVDERDILPIGMYWDDFGAPSTCRQESDGEWCACCCKPWYPRQATCVDANGDGQINMDDKKIIAQFWKSTHETLQKESTSAIATSISDSIGGYIVPGCKAQNEICEALIYIHMVNDVLGTSFELSLEPHDKVEILSVERADFLGNDIIFFYQLDKARSTISVGTTRKKDDGGVSGTGKIVKIRLRKLGDDSIHFNFKKPTCMTMDGSMSLMQVTTAVSRKTEQLPTDFALRQNYPNPFNPSTHIEYELPSNEHVTIEVMNALGQNIFTLVDEEKTAGHHAITWNGQNEWSEPVSSGVYIVAMKAGDFVQTRKMLLLR
jgi:hypothetical protein